MGFITRQLEKRSTLANPSQYLVDYFRGTYQNRSGMDVNEKNAEKCIAVGSCIDRISKTMAMLPIPLYKRAEDGGRHKALKHPLFYILKYSPNPEMTSYIWRLIQTKAYLTYGVCYSKIVFDKKRGFVRSLWPIPPQNVRPRRDPATKKLMFEVWNDDGSYYATIPDEEMFRIFFCTDDGITPKSPIRVYAESIGVNLAAEAFAAKFFGNGSNLAGVLEVAGKLDPEGNAYKNMRKSWEEIYAGIDNSHKVAILEEGTTYKRIGIPPNEAQFVESRIFGIEEIARIYDMPLHRLQHYKGATYNNVEHLDLEFMKYTIMPHAMNWQQAIGQRLLSLTEEKKYYAEFNFDLLLKADTATRSKYYHQMRQDGIMNADEIREKENMNPQKEEEGPGKQYVMNGNMIPTYLSEEFFKAKIVKQTGGLLTPGSSAA